MALYSWVITTSWRTETEGSLEFAVHKPHSSFNERSCLKGVRQNGIERDTWCPPMASAHSWPPHIHLLHSCAHYNKKFALICTIATNLVCNSLLLPVINLNSYWYSVLDAQASKGKMGGTLWLAFSFLQSSIQLDMSSNMDRIFINFSLNFWSGDEIQRALPMGSPHSCTHVFPDWELLLCTPLMFFCWVQFPFLICSCSLFMEDICFFQPVISILSS